eukprot:1445459-Pyramimonas_sp.AAC.1
MAHGLIGCGGRLGGLSRPRRCPPGTGRSRLGPPHRGTLGAMFGPSWADLRPSQGPPGLSWIMLEASRWLLGPFWAVGNPGER